MVDYFRRERRIQPPVPIIPSQWKEWETTGHEAVPAQTESDFIEAEKAYANALDPEYWRAYTKETQDGVVEFPSRGSMFSVGCAVDKGYVRPDEPMEDRVLIDPDRGLFAVIDGVGGLPEGELAATLAAMTLHEVYDDAYKRSDKEHALDEMLLRRALTLIDIRLRAYAKKTGLREVPGACLTVVLFSKNFHGSEKSDLRRKGLIGHLGDTRGRLIRRDGSLFSLTINDSVPEIRYARDIDRERDKRGNKITRLVGEKEADWNLGDRVHVREFEMLVEEEALLLTTDGIDDVLATHEKDLTGLSYSVEGNIISLLNTLSQKYPAQVVLNALTGTGQHDKDLGYALRTSIHQAIGQYMDVQLTLDDVLRDCIVPNTIFEPQKIATAIVEEVKRIVALRDSKGQTRRSTKIDNRTALVIS